MTDIKSIIERLSSNEEMLSYKPELITGVNYLCEIVKVTLGAKGKNVLYNDTVTNLPRITKDGVTAANQVRSSDPMENMAIEIVREASRNTVKTSGDGTTTTIILATALINKGYELLTNKVITYYELSRLIDTVKNDVIEYYKANSLNIEDNFDKLLHVATISSSSSEIGSFIYDIVKEIGIYGSIEVRKSNNNRDKIDQVKGLKLHKGYYAGQFVNDYKKMVWKEQGVYIVLFNDTIRTMNDVTYYLQSLNESLGYTPPVLFFVNDIESTILETLITNKTFNKNFNVMFVEFDGFGDRRTQIMSDISSLVSADILNSNNMEGAIGYAEEVIVNSETTSILGGSSDELKIKSLIEETLYYLESDDVIEYDKVYYKRRLASLRGGVAVIHVGAVTEVEMNERKDRIDDAVEATKAAIDRGISIGGGYTSYHAYKSLLKADNKLYNEILEIIVEPLRQLCINSDYSYDEVIKNISNNKGYNVIDNSFIELKDYNVYDPTGVLIDALTNASAVAKSILSIERSVYNKR